MSPISPLSSLFAECKDETNDRSNEWEKQKLRTKVLARQNREICQQKTFLSDTHWVENSFFIKTKKKSSGYEYGMLGSTRARHGVVNQYVGPSCTSLPEHDNKV